MTLAPSLPDPPSSIVQSTACQIEHIAPTFTRDGAYSDDEVRFILAHLGEAKQALTDVLDARAKRRRAGR